MDFARRQLEKYGWSEGQGLGKKKDGISEALKPKLKFDTFGLGHNLAEEYTNPWWQVLYDEAANNIALREEEGSIRSEMNDHQPTANKHMKNIKKDKGRARTGKYKNFIRKSKLDCAKEVLLHNETEDSNKNKMKAVELSDSELFKICDGRTAHIGARHGLKMSAKLARLERHEKNMISLMNTYNVNKKDTISFKKKIENS